MHRLFPGDFTPMIAPITSGAIVPTTISERAVAIRSQIDSRVASSASPSHRAARAQISVMLNRSYDAMIGAKKPASTAGPRRTPPQGCAAGVISLYGSFGELHPHRGVGQN